MSIEAMKRIKSLLQDTKMIDSHTISAVVAECDMAILAQQPATGEPVAWNSIQIASWIGSQLMHEPSMFERAAVCKFVRSLGRHPTLLKHSPSTHPSPSVPADVMRDAERYRWLRDHDHWPAPFSSSQEPEPVRGRDLDSNIDAAMLAAAPHPQQPKEPS